MSHGKAGNRIAVAGAAAMLTAGCSALAQDCTMIGASDGVTIDISSVVAAAASPVSVTTCIDDTCVTKRGVPADMSTVFSEVALEDNRTVEVTATITEATGAVVFDGSGSTTTVIFEPNGPRCQPQVVRARLRVEGDRLVSA
jgi:hypothetical protein